MINLRNNVKYLRRSEEFDLTQEELADKLGVSRATISAIENGANTSDEVVLKIAHFFGKDPREIFYFDNCVAQIEQGNTKINSA